MYLFVCVCVVRACVCFFFNEKKLFKFNVLIIIIVLKNIFLYIIFVFVIHFKYFHLIFMWCLYLNDLFCFYLICFDVFFLKKIIWCWCFFALYLFHVSYVSVCVCLTGQNTHWYSQQQTSVDQLLWIHLRHHRNHHHHHHHCCCHTIITVIIHDCINIDWCDTCHHTQHSSSTYNNQSTLSLFFHCSHRASHTCFHSSSVVCHSPFSHTAAWNLRHQRRQTHLAWPSTVTFFFYIWFIITLIVLSKQKILCSIARNREKPQIGRFVGCIRV